MLKRTLLASAALIVAGAAMPALAQDHSQHSGSQHSGHDDLAPARLQRLDDQAKAAGFAIDHMKAIEIAKANGVVTVREVDLEDNGEWKVEGRDASGREIEVELSARDGKVREVERD